VSTRDFDLETRSSADRVGTHPRTAWWFQSTNLQHANVRMRAAILMRSLSQQGTEVAWFTAKEVDSYTCVIVNKRYDDDSLMQLRSFKQRGGRLVLDLCDNDFMPSSQGHKHQHRAMNARALAAMADVIVTVSAELARIVTRECPTADRVVVIGDLPDDLSMVAAPPWRQIYNRWKLARALADLDRAAPPGVTRLVWFGVSGGSKQFKPRGRERFKGLSDLARIAPTIAQLAQTHPLHVTVISNSAEMYQSHVAPLLPSSRYIEWDPWTFDLLLRQQHIVLIPAQPNEYAACKSDNRVVSALRAGIAVVADPAPSYAAYGDVIALGDMAAGLLRYLNDPARRISDANRGQAQVLDAGHANRVLAQWIEIL